MGRPSASPINKSVSLVFARALTTRTASVENIIARCGRCSLFHMLGHMLPHIVREGRCCDRGSISEVEFNKVLQVQTLPILSHQFRLDSNLVSFFRTQVFIERGIENSELLASATIHLEQGSMFSTVFAG